MRGLSRNIYKHDYFTGLSFLRSVNNVPFIVKFPPCIFCGKHAVMKFFSQAFFFLCSLLCLIACDNNEQPHNNHPLGQSEECSSTSPSRVLKGSINGAFVASAKNAGLTNNQIHRVASIFRGRIDFRRDLHQGDSFRVLFDKDHSDDAARILAVSVVINGRNRSAYRSMDGQFYDESFNNVSGDENRQVDAMRVGLPMNQGMNGKDKRQFLAKVRLYKRLLGSSQETNSDIKSCRTDTNESQWTDYRVKGDDNLSVIFNTLNLPAKTLHKLLEVDIQNSLIRLKTNQKLSFMIGADNELLQMAIPLDDDRQVIFERKGDDFVSQIQAINTDDDDAVHNSTDTKPLQKSVVVANTGHDTKNVGQEADNNKSNYSDGESSSDNHGNEQIGYTDVIAEKLNDIFRAIDDALGSDIQIVKDTKMNFGNSTMTTQEWIGALVGIRGTANWTEFVTSENIHIVQVDISRKTNRKKESASIQWKVNPDTKFVKMSAIKVNGKEEPILLAVFLLSPWAMASLAD